MDAVVTRKNNMITFNKSTYSCKRIISFTVDIGVGYIYLSLSIFGTQYWILYEGII